MQQRYGGEQRVVFLDIDGTLLPTHGAVPATARAAVAAARAAGHLVFLSTGRSLIEVPDDILAIGFDGVIAASGGHIVLGDGRVLSRRNIPPDAAAEAVALLQSFPVPYFVEAETGAFAEPVVAATLAACFAGRARAAGDEDAGSPAAPDHDVAADRFLPLASTLPTDVDKITFFAAGRHVESVRTALSAFLNVSPPSTTWLGPDGGELTALGVNKGWAIQHVLETLNIPLAASVAIGDSYNDLEMLRTAGVGIAMAGAPAEVLAAAAWSTEPPEADGLANALRRLGLAG